MKAAPLALASFAALLALAPTANAEDMIRACIAQSTDGQTLRKQGKLLAAREQMIACARDACPPIVRSSCARWLSEVDASIPSVVVRALDATGQDVLGAQLSIDGHPEKLDGHPVRLDPGEHVLAIEAEDGAHPGSPASPGPRVRTTERVLLVEGEASRVVTLRLAPSADATKSKVPTTQEAAAVSVARPRHVPLGAWILGGAGLVALGGATYFGLAANGELNDLKATCSPHCAESRTQPGRTEALVFDVLLGAGAALVAGALVWGLAFPSSAPRAASRPRLEVRPIAGGALSAITFVY
jgi:hypothetical protein